MVNILIYEYHIYKCKYSKQKLKLLVIIETYSRNMIYITVVKWIEFFKFQ